MKVGRTVAAKPEAVFDLWMDTTAPGGPWFGASRLLIDIKVDGLFFFSVEPGC